MPKDNIKRITVSEMAPHVHSFNYGENRVEKLYLWLKQWIDVKLKSGEIKPYYFLPAKGDLAFHIGVSKGTIQNVYRMLEDANIVESKQKIGTYIKEQTENNMDKLTSKREITCQRLKQYIIDNNYKQNDKLPSIRTLEKILGISATTIRMSVNCLVYEDIIRKKENFFIVNDLNFSASEITSQTLVEKISEKIEKYVTDNLKSGDRLPPNSVLAKKYKVSVKTIHDSIKILVKAGVLRTRRGQYGTTVSDNNETKLYNYEKSELKIRHYIYENCKIGDKLPPIREFAKSIGVSTKTVKSALDNLMGDGYITCQRGRKGGTFVTDIPKSVKESYTWLALNPNYISAIEN